MRFLRSTSSSFARFAGGFTLPLANQGLVLVSGVNRDFGSAFDQNAVGKSMLFEAALSWCPFGKLARYGNDRIGSEEICFEGRAVDVTDEIETATGTYRLARSRTAKGSPKLTVTVQENGAWAPLRNAALHAAIANDQMIQLLGFDYLTMRSAMILQGSGMDVSGSAFASQMRVLEAVLRFDVYTDAKSSANDRLKLLATREREMVDALASHAHAVQSATETIQELDALDESEREGEVRSRLVQIRVALPAYDGLDQEIATAQAAKQTANRAWLTAHVAHGAACVRADRLVALVGMCPTCEQPIGEDVVATREHALADLAILEAANNEAERVETEADAALAAVFKRRTERDDLVREREQLRRELKDITDRAARRLAIVQAQTARREEAESRAQETTEALAVQRRQIQVATNWARRDFDALKGETFTAGAPYFDDRAAYYSDTLTGGAIRVRLNPVRESRGDDLILIDGASAPRYRGCSAGERRRIDMIVAMSLRALARWRMQGESINVCLYDEVLDPLDDAGVERAMRLVEQDLDASESVFLITHSPRVRALFPNAKEWRVIREGGIARVET